MKFSDKLKEARKEKLIALALVLKDEQDLEKFIESISHCPTLEKNRS
jgi:hypothetical protein